MHSFPFVVKKEMIEKREMMRGCESTVLRKQNEKRTKGMHSFPLNHVKGGESQKEK